MLAFLTGCKVVVIFYYFVMIEQSTGLCRLKKKAFSLYG